MRNPNPTPNVIPPITHELGKYWRQPLVSEILIDDQCAMMTGSTFGKLSDYSHSTPTGAYEGKMWASHDRDGNKHLHWFGFHEDPEMVSGNNRPVILVEEVPQ